MKISDLFFSRRSKKKAEVSACSDSPPPPVDAEGKSAEKDYRDSLKERKKLCLVINLDNVLIDSIDWCDYTKYDRDYFCNSGVQSSYKEGQLHILYRPPNITIKMRPYIRSFLKDMSYKYDIVMYSKRSPAYVDAIRKFLDPDGAINLTVISLENSKSAHHQPQLKAFLSNQDLLVILDDTQKGWNKKYSSNLIKVAPYPYFNQVKMKNKSWTKLKGDECEKGGELYRISHRLGSLCNIIYDPRRDFQDARQVIQKYRSNNCLDNFHSCHVESR